LPGSHGLLISAAPVRAKIAHHQLLKGFDYEGYSRFVLYDLHKAIETRFALIVQQDGWVLNGRNWKSEWLEYDYIGAPCHLARCGDQFLGKFSWISKVDANPMVVFNGGFSLRSKRLMEAPSRLGLGINTFGHKILANEDVQLCCLMRPALEQQKIRFPSSDVAKWFSFEFLGRGLNDNIDLSKVFGQHGQGVRCLIGPNRVQYKLTARQIEACYGESKVFELFAKFYRYSIEQPIDFDAPFTTVYRY
jgi:hypothetical protein